MKILLCTPVKGYGIKIATPPLGLLFIATVLRGHDVKIIDNYLTKSDFEDFKTELLSFNPDIVGISCNVEDRFNAFDTAKFIKSQLPNSFIIFGGPFPTICYHELLESFDFIDVVVVGEGEYTMPELVEAYQQKKDYDFITGVAFRKNGEITFTGQRDFIKNLNDFPMPAYDLIDVKKYPSYLNDYSIYLYDDKEIKNLKYSVSLIFGRGCPFNCSFCSSKELWRRSFRMISPEKAVDQLKYFYNQGIKAFTIWDDHFLLNKKWFNEFYDLIKKSDMHFYFKCLSRVDSIDVDIVKKLREIGCVKVVLGIESGSSNMLKEMDKRITTEQAEEAVKLLYENQIVTEAGSIIDMPGETIEDIRESLLFFKKLDDKYQKIQKPASPVKIYPGADLEKYARKTGFLDGFTWTKPFYEKRNIMFNVTPYVPIYENIKTEKLFVIMLRESIKVEFGPAVRSLLYHNLTTSPVLCMRAVLGSFKGNILRTSNYLGKEVLGGSVRLYRKLKRQIKFKLIMKEKLK